MYFILKSASFPDTIGTIEVTAGEVGSGGSSDGSTSSTCTFTVKPSPSTATVTLTASGYTTVSGTGNQSITVAAGTTVSYTVSADGYVTKQGSKVVSITSSQTVTLVAEGSSDSGSGDSTITTPGSVDDIAWETFTYSDIFVTNNRAPDINGNSMTNNYGNITYSDSAGSTTIVSDSTVADNYVPPYSLYVTGTSSQQAKSSTNYPAATSYFLAANVKVTAYTKGYCGMIFGSQFGACASGVTDGYEVFSVISDNTANNTGNTALFIGSASSANLTGYINNPVAVNMGIFTTAPTLEEMTTLYKNYTALLAG